MCEFWTGLRPEIHGFTKEIMPERGKRINTLFKDFKVIFMSEHSIKLILTASVASD